MPNKIPLNAAEELKKLLPDEFAASQTTPMIIKDLATKNFRVALVYQPAPGSYSAALLPDQYHTHQDAQIVVLSVMGILKKLRESK